MLGAENKLEKYFAKNHAAKYAELGGVYIDYTLAYKVTPMQKYFSSGKYKELNDNELEKLWKAVSKKIKIAQLLLFLVIFAGLVYFAILQN